MMLTTYVLRDGTIPLEVGVATGPLDKGTAFGILTDHLKSGLLVVDESDIEWTPDEATVAVLDDLEILSSTDVYWPQGDEEVIGSAGVGDSIWVLLAYSDAGGTEGPFLSSKAGALDWILSPPATDNDDQRWLVEPGGDVLSGFLAGIDYVDLGESYAWAWETEVNGS